MLKSCCSRLAVLSRQTTCHTCPVVALQWRETPRQHQAGPAHAYHSCLARPLQSRNQPVAQWQPLGPAHSLAETDDEDTSQMDDQSRIMEEFLRDFDLEQVSEKNRQKYLDMIDNLRVQKEAQKKLDSLPADKKKLLAVLELEYDAWFSLGYKVPRHVRPTEWLKILACQSEGARERTYYKWEAKERFKTQDKISGIKRRAKLYYRKAVQDVAREEVKSGHPQGYIPDRFLRTYHMSVREHAKEQFYTHRAAYAMTQRHDLVIDCSFEHANTKREIKELCKQIQIAYADMKRTKEPVHLVLTGLKPDSYLYDTMQTFWPNFDRSLITVNSQEVEELYPRDQLVILSPNARGLLHEYDYNKTYVIGGLVDLGSERPLTVAKAKKMGIQCKRLPLDKYLKWEMGGKALPINHMVLIMQCAFQTKNNWRQAFNVIPKHKIRYWR